MKKIKIYTKNITLLFGVIAGLFSCKKEDVKHKRDFIEIMSPTDSIVIASPDRDMDYRNGYVTRGPNQKFVITAVNNDDICNVSITYAHNVGGCNMPMKQIDLVIRNQDSVIFVGKTSLYNLQHKFKN